MTTYITNNANSIDKTRLGLTFQRIAKDIVESLSYTGAMIALLEEDNALPVYAFYIDPKLVTVDQLHQWETRISKLLRRSVSISDPELARVYVDDDHYQENLSVRAYKKKEVVISNDLFSLFTPIIPSNKLTRPLVNDIIQPALKVKQVIAVPFFLESPGGKDVEIVGNLFAAKSASITAQDVQILTAFGHHAAAAIEIERNRLQTLRVAKHLTTQVQTKIKKEDDVLQEIAESVVNILGYVGAMVATYNEEDDSLPVRAFFIDPKLASQKQIQNWEARLSSIMAKEISLSDPEVAKVYLKKPEYDGNLSIQAVNEKAPVISDELLSLLIPIIPSTKLTRPAVSLIQRALKISQVIAVPFFLQTEVGKEPQILGNLFAATVHPSGFQNEEIELLQAFGQQAAASIFNAQLYKEIDDQRQVAQVFGTMAFSASKSIHQFRNDIGFIRGQLQLLPYIEQFPDEQKREIIASTPKVIERIDIIRDRLDQLHKPWQSVQLKPTSINTCLINARNKVIPEHKSHINVIVDIDESLPLINAVPDMLTEAFIILIKNAVEAISSMGNRTGELKIVSKLAKNSSVLVEIIDNGYGIKPENVRKIFHMRWSTKETGLGFGLFWTKDFFEGLGGEVKVDSTWQKGTTFQIYIPVTQPN